LHQFKEAHPEFQLADVLFRVEGGNVVDSFFGQKYTRKKESQAAQGPFGG
jgi:hypothetical protein